MNVFVIPTWYPHRCHPLEGIFIRDQAMALGDLRPDWNIAYSHWGQGQGRISIAHYRTSLLCLFDALRSPRSFDRSLTGNVVEFFERAFTWNESFLEGNRGGILEANRRNLDRAVERFGRIDLLHAHVSYPAGWVAMKLSERTGIPYVVTEHMGPFPLPVYERPDGALASFIREPLERAAARMAVSPALAERVASFGIPKPEYVPNLVDERLYTGEPHEPRDRFVFFTLGGMQPVKGFPDLLEAISQMIRQLPEADRERIEFRLAGYGPCLEDYQALARRLGIERWIVWPGFLEREQARREFRNCDCYVMSSLHESFGIVIVEAMASGRPVVATRCGGPNDIVKPENGILVDVGRPSQLAEAMLAMFRGEKTYDSAAIREKILRDFSRFAVVDRLTGIYERALGSAASTPSLS